MRWLILAAAVAMMLAALPASASVGSVTAGNSLIDRPNGPDSWSNFVIIDTNHPVNSYGFLTSWSFYAKAGRSYDKIQLKVYRPGPGGFEVIGTSDLIAPTTVPGINTFSLGSAIPVKPGDVLGMYITGQGIVPYSIIEDPHYAAGNLTYVALFTDNTSGTGAAVGQFENVTASGMREYSLAASGIVSFDNPTTSCSAGELYVSSGGSGSSTPIVDSAPLVAGIKYSATASGVYYAGGRGTYDIEADAKYTQDFDQRLTNTWTDSVHNYESYGPGLLELTVNGGTVDWGAFNPTHIYTYDLGFGDGTPAQFQFQISDIYAQNNTGGLCVRIDRILPDTVMWLPPMTNADFFMKDGSTLPIKFQVSYSDGAGPLAPEQESVYLTIDGITGTTPTWTMAPTADEMQLQFDYTTMSYTGVFHTKDFAIDSEATLTAFVHDSATDSVLGSFAFTVDTAKGTSRGNSGK